MNRTGIALWTLICAILVLDIGLHCVRAQDSASKLIKTHQLDIVDTDGNARIILNLGKDGNPAVRLQDQKGNTREALVAGPTGGDLGMLNATGQATLLVAGSDQPDAEVYKNGKLASLLGVRSDGWPVFTLHDTAGNERVFLGYDPKGDRGILQLEDKDQKQVAEMAQTPSYSTIDVTDKQGILRARIRCGSDGGSGIYVMNSGGDVVWSQTDPSGQ